jgi:hypothetical protein
MCQWGKATAQLSGRPGSKALVSETFKRSYNTEEVR